MWTKLDDHFSENPKMVGVGPLGRDLYVRALCYASRNLTDGFIPRGIVSALLAEFVGIGVPLASIGKSAPASTGGTADAASIDWQTVMVSAGLWEPASGGFNIHDFLEFNPTREAVLAERKKTAQRVSTWRKRHAGNEGSNGVTNGVSTPPPVPAPVPVPVPVPTPKRERGGSPRAAVAAARPSDLDEVRRFWAEGELAGDPEAFFDHFEGNGWLQGKALAPVRNWRAAARNWSRREPGFGPKVSRRPSATGYATASTPGYDHSVWDRTSKVRKATML